jgi:hypothetical protein
MTKTRQTWCVVDLSQRSLPSAAPSCKGRPSLRISANRLREWRSIVYRIRFVLCVFATAVVAGGSNAGALASPAQTPTPTPGTPSCNGLIIASFNQASGPFGASGNPYASAGPGFFLGTGTHQAILDQARGPNC